MTSRKRKPNELAGQAMPLVLLGMALIASNRYVTFVNNEARCLNAAVQSVQTLATSLFAGTGPQNIPFLYGVVLHFWLRWTAWNFEYLRIPAIVFFLAGLFFVGRTAQRFAGPVGASAAIWLGILWPFGFHYGRLAGPFAFVFFLLAGLTFTYLRCVEENTFGRWGVFFLFGAVLLWSSFLGWAMLACLAVDQALRRRSGERTLSSAVMARTLILWMAAFIPVMRVSYGEFRSGMNIHQGFFSFATGCLLNVYNLFISESIAPWYWHFSVPAGLAVLVCIFIVFRNVAWPSRRFLLYGAGVIFILAAMGILTSDRLAFIAPWILLPIAVAIGSIESRWARPTLAAALLLIGGIGWFGIYSRSYYSAPEFLEPWVQVAGDAVAKIQTGATVISNSGPFFLYLTYALRPPGSAAVTHFEGLLPDSIHHSAVKSAEQWMSSDHSRAPTMVWVHGSGEHRIESAMDNVAAELDHNCGSRVSRLMARDTGFGWKQRFLPAAADAPWRVEVREYDCTSSNTMEIFPIPSRRDELFQESKDTYPVLSR